jgi:phosphonate transport system substrate-binding protein
VGETGVHEMKHARFGKAVFRFITYEMILIFSLSVITLTGCSRTETELSGKPAPPRKGLLIGLIPEQNIFKQLELYEPLAAYLSKKSGIKIQLKVLSRYGNIAKNFTSLGLDGAFLGSFTYTLAHAQLGVEPVARPEYDDGTSTYYGMIFVRKDSGINTAEDMKGKVFAFVDKATTAGYLLPLAYFKEHGIEDYTTYLKEFYFAGTHEDTIYDVLNKRADIGAAKNTVYYSVAETDNRINQELVILGRSPDVPQNGLAFRKDLDINVRNSIKNALLTMHDDLDGKKILKDFRAKRFIETTDDDYAAVYKYIHNAGLNLKTYQYVNR